MSEGKEKEMNNIPANPGYKVLFAREHGFEGETYIWYEAEDVIHWRHVDGRLLPVTIKHDMVDYRAKYPRYEGIVTPSGEIVTSNGTFSSIEELRKHHFEWEVRERQGQEIMNALRKRKK